MTNMKISLIEQYKKIQKHFAQSGKTGIIVFACTLIFLSLVAGTNLKKSSRVLLAGEIAPYDVIADRDLLVEDTQATKARKEQVALLQPAIFDLSSEPISLLRERLHDIFQLLNNADIQDLAPIRLALSEEFNREVSYQSFELWRDEKLQRYVTRTLVPWLAPYLAKGVASDLRVLTQFKGGIIIHDMDNGDERLRTELYSISDIRGIMSEISQYLKNDQTLTLRLRHAIIELITPLLPPTLTLNRKATINRAKEVANAIQPTYYRLQRGEVIVRQGEHVTREQQLKIQSIFGTRDNLLRSLFSTGVLVIAFLLGFGLFVSPCDKINVELPSKNLLFISALLLLFSLVAKCINSVAPLFIDGLYIERIAYCYPVAGAAGLFALIFSARRYYVVSLLLSFFCTVMFQGGLSLFLFYFLGSMLNTWLLVQAQTRQSAVWSFFPLLGGLLIIGLGSSLLYGIRGSILVQCLLFVSANAMLSTLLLFALSPIFEIAFHSTTRFRLMELMNLEQPLLQELMVKAPGTYHHSLIVANMVEAGAKAIGANSLLCKVAALYHDIGKLSKPNYFIENQFSHGNKHDKLTPSMSALIITNHVKHGVELAKKHRLGSEIVAVIQQHHGSRCIRNFYQKALDAGENPRESDFSYPGPRPQSKEAAIVMLADVVEASSRTLQDPTPARIRHHIYTMVMGVFSEGQLDESELTFKELHILSENFLCILTGIFHHRIEYPDTARENQKYAELQNKKKHLKKTDASNSEAPTTSTKAASEPNNANRTESSSTPTAPHNSTESESSTKTTIFIDSTTKTTVDSATPLPAQSVKNVVEEHTPASALPFSTPIDNTINSSSLPDTQIDTSAPIENNKHAQRIQASGQKNQGSTT